MGGRSKPALTLLAAAAVAACLAACGGSDSSTSTAPPAETVSARSAPFAKYSGKGAAKLHIAEFGTEGSDSDRTEVEAAIDAYLPAIGAGRWQSACHYLSASLMSQIDQIAERSKRPVKPTCAEILQALVESANAQSGESLVTAPQGIASLRIKEGPGGGFALFHGSDGKDHWMTVGRAGETWGVSSPTPEAFPSGH